MRKTVKKGAYSFVLLLLCLSLNGCAAQKAIDIPLPQAAVGTAAPTLTSAVLLTPGAASTQTATQTIEPKPSQTPAPAADETIKDEKKTPLQTQGEEEAQSMLTDEQKAAKAALKEEYARLKTLTPGADYSENRLMALVQSNSEAQAIAAAYGIKLLDFDAGVALYETDKPVLELIALAAQDNNLPPVYPDYRVSMHGGN